MNASEDMVPVGIDIDGTPLYIGDTVLATRHKNIPSEYVGLKFRIERSIKEGDLSFVDILNVSNAGLQIEDILIATCLDVDHGQANDMIVPKTVRKMVP